MKPISHEKFCEILSGMTSKNEIIHGELQAVEGVHPQHGSITIVTGGLGSSLLIEDPLHVAIEIPEVDLDISMLEVDLDISMLEVDLDISMLEVDLDISMLEVD